VCKRVYEFKGTVHIHAGPDIVGAGVNDFVGPSAGLSLPGISVRVECGRLEKNWNCRCGARRGKPSRPAVRSDNIIHESKEAHGGIAERF
jgi:hypothetical protein